MTRDNIEAQCLRISANYESSGYCRFVRGGGVLCFIDTSQSRNGTRGIAFKRDGIVMCLGKGERHEIAFSSIKDIHIISSFEDVYADELMIVCDEGEVRVSDYSLDKFELKRFIEELSVESKKALEHRAQAEEYAKIIAERLAQSTLREERRRYSERSVSPIKAPSGSEVSDAAEEREVTKEVTIFDVPTADEKNNIHNNLYIGENAAIVESHSDSEESIHNEITEKVISNQTADEDPDVHNDQIVDESHMIMEDRSVSDLENTNDTEISKRQIDYDDDFYLEEEAPVIQETVIEIPEERVLEVPENYDPVPIPEEKINWISGSFYTKKKEVPEETPVISVSETIEEKTVIDEYKESEADNNGAEDHHEVTVLYSRDDENAPSPKIDLFGAAADEEDKSIDNAPSDGEAMTRIQNMTREETLSYLAESLNEINGISDSEQSEAPGDVSDNAAENSGLPSNNGGLPAEIDNKIKTISDMSAPPESAVDDGKLTVEPIWGDIYIKASRNLRELIEDGRLSMEQIKTELKDKLLSSARAFVEVTADEAKVPKVLVPKITELRSASKNFDEYFKSGEDIGVRTMFFMMYQMLSYADRIAETPETKERLNDFFRRFGSAGITFSMLDMRV